MTASKTLHISQALSRIPSREEWGRLKKYTASVITLFVPSTDNVRLWTSKRAWVSVETIQLIGLESQRGGFWPRLCSLGCNFGWDIVPFLSSFLNPTITTLGLSLPREGNQLLQPTLSLLTHTCRQLQSLTVDADTSDPPSGSEICHLISASRHTLRRIDIKSFTPPDIFPVIFDLPRLQDLTLQNPHFPNRIPPNVLPRFQTIDFRGSHGPNLTQFLRGVPVLALTKVTISHGGVIQLSATLGPLRGASATMNTIRLSPVMALDNSSVTLLRSFTSLTCLSIGCACTNLGMNEPCSFQLTDGNILELGRALPHIRSLSLAPFCRGPRHVTFASLVYLSKTCGELGDLSIRVDFTSIARGCDQPHRYGVGTGVNIAHIQRAKSTSWMSFGNSPLPDFPHCEWAVALALVVAFPSISYLTSDHLGEMTGRWEKVKGNILVCKEIFRATQATGKHLNTSVV